MAPAKRNPAKPASKRPTRATKKDGTPLLGPDGEPIDPESPTEDASGDSDPPAETGQVEDPEDRETTQSPRRSRGLYPLPVWPD